MVAFTKQGNIRGPAGPAGAAGAQGSAGATGAQGSAGATGATGARGSLWTTGTGAPTASGTTMAGDQYLDVSTGDVYTAA